MGIRSLLGLSRTVWLLGLISFINDTAGELVYPLLPVYFAVVLQIEPRIFGFIEGSALSINSLLQLVSGRLSDKTASTKIWVVSGYGIAALSRPLLALAHTWPMALIFRLSDRVGKGLRSAPRDALLAISSAPEQRGLAFGFHRAMDNIGAVAGPLLAAWCLEQKIDIRLVLVWTILPGLATVLLTLFLREAPRPRHDLVPFDWRWSALSPAFRQYLKVLALFTLGYPSSLFFLLRAKELGIPDFQVPILWAVTSLVTTVCSTPLSVLSDRIGRRPMIIAGWVVYIVVLLLLGLYKWSTTSWLWPLFAVYGLFFAATEGSQKALVADIAPAHGLGTAFGWFHLITGLLLLPASFLFGWISEYAGASYAFLFPAACATLAICLFISMPFTK